MSVLDVLTQPYMLEILFVGFLSSIMLPMIGVFITLRGKAFLTDGIAHASLTGVAIGLVYLGQPLLLAMLVAVLMAVIITYLEKNSKLKNDAIIGIVYTVLFSLGVIIINTSKSYQPELTRFLFGSLLFVSDTDILIASLVFLLIVSTIVLFYPKLVYITFDPESAYIRGIKVEAWDYIINILSALAVIASLKLVGIILVSGLIIIPATIAKLTASKFKYMLPYSVITGVIGMLAGIIASYYLQAPPGATIVMCLGVLFVGVFALSKVKTRWQ